MDDSKRIYSESFPKYRQTKEGARVCFENTVRALIEALGQVSTVEGRAAMVEAKEWDGLSYCKITLTGVSVSVGLFNEPSNGPRALSHD